MPTMRRRWLGLLLAFRIHVSGNQAHNPAWQLCSTALLFLKRCAYVCFPCANGSDFLSSPHRLHLGSILVPWLFWSGFFGFGLFSVGGTARSADDSPSFSETDLQGGMCFMMHMAGDESKLNCIKKTACAEPTVAAQYATASKMMYKVFKLLK